MSESSGTPVTRRDFVRRSAGTLAGAALVLGSSPGDAQERRGTGDASHAPPEAAPGIPESEAASNPIRVGLVGCGGRGRGAAANALEADAGVRVVALGDLFRDQLEAGLRKLQGCEYGDRVDVPPERRFVGFDAYERVIAEVDVVLLATPPHFRPLHIEAAIAAGRHVFAEKPVAVDPAGVRRARAACASARTRGLTFLSGFCYRHDEPKQQLMARLHGGAIGDLRALQCTYNTGALWHRGRRPEWSDVEWQVRNWLYFTWLSGDHITEQSCHSIDKLLWAMENQPPQAVVASGGRIVRTDPKFGDVYDHFNSVFEWPGGVKGFHSCRQWADADSDVSDYAFGSEGTAAIQHHRIDGPQAWRYRGDPESMYVREHRDLFASVRRGAAFNDGESMCDATLMAIAARMSAYTGKRVTWQQALESKLDLTPAHYEFGPLPVAPVAQPGRTPFV